MIYVLKLFYTTVNYGIEKTKTTLNLNETQCGIKSYKKKTTKTKT